VERHNWYYDLETSGFEIDVMCDTSHAHYEGKLHSRIHLVLKSMREKAILTVDEMDGLEFRRSLQVWEVCEIAAFKLRDTFEALARFFGDDVDCCMGHNNLEQLCQVVDGMVRQANLVTAHFHEDLRRMELGSEAED